MKLHGFSDIVGIGSGRFSTVFAAIRSNDSASVVLKHLFISAGASVAAQATVTSARREISALEVMRDSPNVVTLLGHSRLGSDLFIHLERMEMSLFDFLEGRPAGLPEPITRSIVYQILSGLRDCHSLGIVHRDVKPGNVLISPSTGSVKICDFGLAQIPGDYESGPHDICTRWYKPIEVLLGTRLHTAAIDVWSVGCVWAEILSGRPLFPGNSDLHQLFLIYSALGEPDESKWPGVTELPDYGKFSFNLSHPLSSSVSPAAPSHLNRMLEYDPAIRVTVADCLSSDYFDPPPTRIELRSLINPH
jgi:serine/threonine protein kinase